MPAYVSSISSRHPTYDQEILSKVLCDKIDYLLSHRLGNIREELRVAVDTCRTLQNEQVMKRHKTTDDLDTAREALEATSTQPSSTKDRRRPRSSSFSTVATSASLQAENSEWWRLDMGESRSNSYLDRVLGATVAPVVEELPRDIGTQTHTVDFEVGGGKSPSSPLWGEVCNEVTVGRRARSVSDDLHTKPSTVTRLFKSKDRFSPNRSCSSSSSCRSPSSLDRAYDKLLRSMRGGALLPAVVRQSTPQMSIEDITENMDHVSLGLMNVLKRRNDDDRDGCPMEAALEDGQLGQCGEDQFHSIFGLQREVVEHLNHQMLQSFQRDTTSRKCSWLALALKIFGLAMWSRRDSTRQCMSVLYMAPFITAPVVVSVLELIRITENNPLTAIVIGLHALVALYCRLYLIWWLGQTCSASRAMRNYARHHMFEERWWNLSIRYACVTAVACTVYTTLLLWSVPSIAVILAEILEQITISLMVWFSALTISFCSLAADDLARRAVCLTLLDGIIVRYTILCAVVRKVSTSIEQAIVCLTNCGAITMVLVLLVVLSGVSVSDKVAQFIASSSLLGMAVALLHMIATVNLKFKRLPMIVNTMNFGCEIDHDKWCVVSFMQLNEGGFYLYGMRLMREAAMKALWLILVSGSFMLMRMLGVAP